jgi:hypothetical protein
MMRDVTVYARQTMLGFERATEYVSPERERGRGCTGRKRLGMTST